MKKILMTMMMCCVVSAIAFAQETSIQAKVSQNKVGLGQAFKLEITVKGASIDTLDLPALDGLDIQYVGPSRRVTIINGISSTTVSFNYTVFPQRTGKFTIPALRIDIDGKPYATDAIDIEVVDSSSGISSDGTTLDDKLFVKVKLKKEEAFVGEQVPVHIRLFVSEVSMQDVEFPIVESLGFSMDDFQSPTQHVQTLNGVQYRIVDFNTNIYPTRTGDVDIGPIKIGANILHEQSNQDPFGGRFFSGFFNTYQKQPVVLQAPATVLKVRELPSENRPDHFSGAVGQFDFTASVGPTAVRVGDPLTLKMSVSGTGDLRAISLPIFDDDMFKTYDPQIKEEAGVKSLEQVIIPTSQEITEVPAITFHYFDPIVEAYKTVKRGPFLIDVEESIGGDEFKMVGFDDAAPRLVTKQEKFGRDMVFIKDGIGDVRKRGQLFLGSVWFYIIVIGYIFSWLIIAGYLAFRQKLHNDPYFARRIQAFKKATKELDDVDVSSAQACHEIYTILKNYFSDRYQLPRGEIGQKELIQFLKQHHVDESIIEKMTLIFNICEEARFGGQQVAVDIDQLKQIVKDVLVYCQEKIS